MIGERLLDLRKDAGLTQDELAAILKINKHSISSYEREKSEPPDVIKIAVAEYFDVSVDYLLGVTDNTRSFRKNTKYLELPCGFPDFLKEQVMDYAEFLKEKYTKKQK